MSDDIELPVDFGKQEDEPEWLKLAFAGMDKAITARKIYEAGRKVGEKAGMQKGRQEVVAFVVENIFPLLKMGSVPVAFIDRWNAKTKEWLERKK